MLNKKITLVGWIAIAGVVLVCATFPDKAIHFMPAILIIVGLKAWSDSRKESKLAKAQARKDLEQRVGKDTVLLMDQVASEAYNEGFGDGRASNNL